jgi:uncharacterized membrane protein
MMTSHRIKVISRRFRLFFQFLVILTPVLVCMNWSNWDLWHQFAHVDQEPYGTSIQSLHFSSRFLAIVTSMIPASLWMAALFYLSRLFRLYEQDLFFTQNNVNCIKNIGYALFAQAIARFLTEPILSLVVTMNNPPGKRLISISFGTPDIYSLVISGVVIIVAWVMHEGQKLQEESNLVV